MDDSLASTLLPHGGKGSTSLSASSYNLKGSFAPSLAGLTAVLFALLATLFKYAHDVDDQHTQRYYMYLRDVYVMVFLGFGFLMTFLKRYSFSAIGLNMVGSCLVILEAVVCVGVVQQGVTLSGGLKLGGFVVDLPLVIDAAFCAGAAMITFGAVLGKASPTQVIWLLALEVPIYALNAHIVSEYFEVLDVGGSITIHAFGAFFGIAASVFLSPPGSGADHPKNGASYSSDMTAMLGTLFLFIYWPSFNGALASAPGAEVQPQIYCIMNTVVALLGACLAAFIASAAFEGKFNMVHIQNATLAGGVAIGSSANLRMAPAAALAVGLVAGLLSVTGYVLASPALEARLGLTDTCGVFNLHGCPGVLGGLASALFAALFINVQGNDAVVTHGGAQPWYQLLGLAITLGAAVGGGLLAGFVVSKVNLCRQELAPEGMFEDSLFWHEGGEEHEE